jgi:hypothetical protein
MTAATDETWIQGSLARLETLEAQRAQLAARGQSAALAEVEEEIHALYEVLESAAGEEQASANTGMAPAPAYGMAPAPAYGMAPAPAATYGMAPAPAPAPAFGMAPAPAYAMGGPDPMQASSSYDAAGDDDKPSRSPLPFILVGVLVLGGGIAAAMAMGNGDDKEAKPAATEPAKVIKSGNIVEDTQEPQVAKGANADRTSGTKYKESPPEDRADTPRPSSSGSVQPRPKPKKDEGRKLTVEKSNDPLAGID